MVLTDIIRNCRSIFPVLALTIFLGCSGKSKHESGDMSISPDSAVEGEAVKALFSGDSAYRLIEKQLDFGFRIPGSKEHENCSAWLQQLLSERTDTIIVQTGEVRVFNGTILPIRNILGRLNVEAKNRVMFLAHYDSRPWADSETDISKAMQPIPGANDGGSGTAVVLELARILNINGYRGGVDFLLVDAEDYGIPEHLADGTTDTESTWCLGTQYWVENFLPFLENPPQKAVLLDMVGGKGAQFNPELISKLNAPGLVNGIWNTAQEAGYGDYFVEKDGNGITDDHLFLIRAGIPSIDIIENDNPDTGSFNSRWHTIDDNMDGIDRQTLEAVGRTLQKWIMKQ